jgi:TolB-like protein/Flp pilus assembly protein TadD
MLLETGGLKPAIFDPAGNAPGTVIDQILPPGGNELMVGTRRTQGRFRHEFVTGRIRCTPKLLMTGGGTSSESFRKRGIGVIYRFSGLTLDTSSFELKRGDEDIALEPQVFSLLLYLLENRDRIVSKDDLIAAVWDGRIVSDAALNSRINAVRRAVGDDGKAQAIVKTFPRRGFRFVADVVQGMDTVVGRKDSANAPPEDLRSGRPSIAVLPFDNLSADPDQAFFADGIAEDIVAALIRLPQFFVIERNATQTYRGQAIDVRVVAQELGVAYVVEGSVRKVGNRVRVSAQLIDAPNRKPLWAEKYDRELTDIFAIQDEITRNIVGSIEPELQDSEWQRAHAKPLEELGVWELYHRGMASVWDRSGYGQPEKVKTAKKLLNDVIEREPDFAPAHAGLAICSYALLMLGNAEDPVQEMNEGLKAGQRAIALAEFDYFSQNALSQIHITRKESEQAIEHGRIAVRLNPSSARANYNLAQALIYAGRASEGIERLELSLQLNPRDIASGSSFVRRAEAHFQIGEYEKAIDWATRALRSPVTQTWGNSVLAAALGKLGRVDEATQAVADLKARRAEVTIDFVRKNFPVTDEAFLEDYLDGLRKAGLT